LETDSIINVNKPIKINSIKMTEAELKVCDRKAEFTLCIFASALMPSLKNAKRKRI